MAGKLLVIDDEEVSRKLLTAIFRQRDFQVLTAADGPSGIQTADREVPDVIILDLNLPGMDGIEVLERLKRSAPRVPVIMLTAEREVRPAVRATRLGAFDYLTKPIDVEQMAFVVSRAMETHRLMVEVDELRDLVKGEELARQMGPSAAVRDITEQVGIVAASPFTVLVTGETGTGKELVAQAIHRLSDRRRKPFMAIDCGAIPETLIESELFGHERGAFTGAERRREGRFKLAEGGTFFLDEVGNLGLPLQAKLLRVLESREVQAVGAPRGELVDVRFVAATNDDLRARVADGKFRVDLYFRLAQYTITLPPLRARRDDIAYLAQRFLEEASVELRHPVHAFTADAVALLVEHPWPGNVRELRNLVRGAVLRSRELEISADAVRTLLGAGAAPPPEAARGGATTGPSRTLREIAADAAREAEKAAILEALEAAGGNKTEAAKALRTDYKTLHVKMKQLGISRRAFGG